ALMGLCRFLYANEITAASQIAVSSSFYGVISGIYAEQLGSATVQNGGLYSASEDKGYIIEIDGIGAGKEVGQATFKWSDDDGQTWTETGVTTQTGAYEISNGVTVQFAAGTGDDCELGDKWSWICKNNYGTQKIFDLDRDFAYRSRSLDDPNTITLTFSEAKNITALAILDHNLSSAAVITLMGNTSDAWDAPAYSQVIPWNPLKIGYYLDQTYRYWRVQVSDQSNTDGYIEIGELYLGPYLEPSKNYSYGWEQSTNSFETVQKSNTGAEKISLDYLQEDFQLVFGRIPETDIDSLLAMFREIKNEAAGTVSPVYFFPDSASANNFFLVHMGKAFIRESNFLDQYTITLKLTEAVKSNV
ncbi:MAG: hypothetical protein JRC93_12715, partial [Deltaproteobacteria bacterium]|nr:hypothetical protein [Deltaproteobacteria bacterium]